MASTYMNSFYLLGDDESVDVSELYASMKKKAVLEVPSSPPKSRKEYTVFGEEPERLVYDDEPNCEPSGSNGKGNLAKNGTTKKTYVQQGQSYGGGRRGRGNYHRVQHSNGGVNGDSKFGDGERPRRNGNWNDGGNRRGRGNGGYRGQGRGGIEYRRIDNGGHSNANSEGDSRARLESSNGKEAGIKETVEEVNGDVPEPEETPEQQKEREIAELKKKEWEEKRRKWEQEEAEEAKKMTLDQYEKLVLEKKQKLNLQKEEARRVVAADKDLENMKLVGKKQDIGDILIVGKAKPKAKAVVDKPKKIEEKLKKSDSLDKQGHKPVAVSVAKLFERASFGGSHRDGRGQGGGNQSGFGRRFPYRGGSVGNNGTGKFPTEQDVKFPTEQDFPVLSSVAHKLETVPSAALGNAPAPSGTNSSTSESIDRSAASSSRSGSVAQKPETVPSAPLANKPTPSGSNLSASGSTDKSAASSSRSGSRANHARTGHRAPTRGATTRSASARSDTVKAEH
ncbi:uncharacterized protein LOC141592104 [Silene latifolia]|uniref:uncharacterized protein LOC141592104 n=1 Tax=Silene latifolia TaxID=37657 RepID=UPI003D7842B5